GLALLTLAEPAMLDWHDRFVLREAGRGETLGGGVVLEAHPQDIRRRQPFAFLAERARRRAAVDDRAAYFLVVLEEEGTLPVKELSLRTGLDPAAARAAGGLWFPSVVLSAQAFAVVSAKLVAALRRPQ